MMNLLFQQALVEAKSVLVIHATRMTLPILPPAKGYDTPYLRRRMQRHKRGLLG